MFSTCYEGYANDLSSSGVVMFPPRSSVWRGIIFTSILFVVDFVLHIIFAANGWDIAFKVIAIELAILSICFAPIALLFGGPTNHEDGLEVIQIGTWFAVPLTVGYFWAVNGMTWSIWLIGTTAFPLLSRILWYRWERGFSLLLYSPLIDEEE